MKLPPIDTCIFCNYQLNRSDGNSFGDGVCMSCDHNYQTVYHIWNQKVLQCRFYLKSTIWFSIAFGLGTFKICQDNLDIPNFYDILHQSMKLPDIDFSDGKQVINKFKSYMVFI